MLLTWTWNWSSPAQDIKTSMNFAGVNGQSCSYKTQAWICTLKTWSTMEGSLFCFVLSCLVLSCENLPNHRPCGHTLGTIGKPFVSYGCTKLVSWCLDILYKSYWTIEPFFHWKFNKIKTTFFFREIGLCSCYYWESRMWVGFNEGDFVTFRPKASIMNWVISQC